MVLGTAAPEPAVLAGRAKGLAVDLRTLVPGLLERAQGRGGGSPELVQAAAADGARAREAWRWAVEAVRGAMEGRMRIRWTMLLALAALAAPSRLEAAAWSEVFAADTDTMVFIGADGALVRAPFSLAARETLWTPPAGQDLVRVRVSPDGRRVAWLARGFDRDTTRLWVDGAGSGGPRVRYFALLPDAYGRVHSEAAVPSLEDAGVRGARLVRPGPLDRRAPCNSLEWTPDSRAVVFGYDDGIAAVPVDGGAGFGVSRALAVGLTALEPAPIYLVDAVVLRAQSTYFAPEGRGVHPSEMAVPLEDGRPVLDALELAHPDVLVCPRGQLGHVPALPDGPPLARLHRLGPGSLAPARGQRRDRVVGGGGLDPRHPDARSHGHHGGAREGARAVAGVRRGAPLAALGGGPRGGAAARGRRGEDGAPAHGEGHPRRAARGGRPGRGPRRR